MSSDDQVYTATRVQLRKISQQSRQTQPVNTKSACWARDQAVTSTMPPSPPYDCTTPPSIPRPNERPRTPRPPIGTSATYEIVDARSARPAVFQHGPFSMPRGFGPRDNLCEAFTREGSPTKPPRLRKRFTEAANTYIPPRPRDTRYRRPLPPITTWRDHQRQQNDPFHTVMSTQKNDREEPVSTLTFQAQTPKVSTAIKAAEWAAQLVRKKRRPSEIFNMSFSFNTASQRQPCDHTPQISPRSSMSKAQVTPTVSDEESFKRQRIDSTGSDMTLGFPFGKPTSPKSQRGRDLGSPAMRPRDSSTHFTPPCSRNNTYTEAHPGELVDFASPCIPPGDSSFVTEYDLCLYSDAYHDYLATSTRRKSFPTGEWAARRIRDEVQMLARLENLDTEAEEFAPSKIQTASLGRKRACTLERKERTSRKAAPRSCASSTAASLSSSSMTDRSFVHGASPLRRSTSDPSTDAFLKHVRASLEARRERQAKIREGAWRDYPVFADESERGFLDDRPL